MKQVWISEKGAPETLQLREAPDPEAATAHRYIQDRKNFGKVLLQPSTA